MKRLTYLVVVLLFCNLTSIAQDTQGAAKTGTVPTDYDRNALTVIVLDDGGNFSTDLNAASANIEVPGKFDDNNVETRHMYVDESVKAIKKALIKKKIPNEILAKWFSRKENGEFDMTVIHERGMYNATDDEVRKASSTKIGLAKLKDAGESLLKHSYILVLDFDDIKSMEEIYDSRDKAKKAVAEKLGTDYVPVDRVKNGWKGKVNGYLYKLNFNDSIIDVFYNSMWIYADDDEATKAEKKVRFDNATFPIKYIESGDGSADGSQYNAGHPMAPPEQLSRVELFQKMISSGIDGVMFDFERKVEDFKVKTPLYDTKPLKAKVGKKEGLRTDSRYFALEFQMNRKGETVAKRKGVVRAKEVVDNRQVATGDTKLYTTFYQVAGRRLQPGMLLQQRRDFGFGISGGVAFGKIAGGYGKLEVNLNSLASSFLDLGVPQLKAYGLVGMQTKKYKVGGTTYDDMNFTRLQVGLSKGYYFARVFSFVPYVGYTMETATSESWRDDNNLDDDANIGVDMINAGAYLSMNVTYWMQLIGSANFYVPFGYAYDKDRESLNTPYTDYFEGRKGFSLEAGLRIEF